MRLIAMLFLGFVAASPSQAQCPGWLAGQLAPYDGVAYASTVWDPDGAGPSAPRLVVGGWFSAVTSPNTISPNVAMYSGVSWAPLGSGLELGLLSAAVYNGDLYAGLPGFFGAGGGVARWNGSQWLLPGATRPDGEVHAMTVFNGELIAVGSFELTDGSGSDVAAWNGTTWRALGTGAFTASSNDDVRCVHVHNGQLFIGGRFETIGGQPIRRVARWTGTAWTGLGTGINDPNNSPQVTALATYQNELIAAGRFSVAGGVSANNFARWDGVAWRSIPNPLTVGEPRLTVFGGELIAGDVSNEAVVPPMRGVAKWNGARWATLRETASDLSRYADVKSFTVFNGELIVGGTFSLAGANPVESLARWNGSAWLDMPGVTQQSTSTPGVNAITTFDGKLVLGGIFAGPETAADYQATVDNLISWDGVETSRIAEDERPDGAIIALFSRSLGLPTLSNILYAGGAFTKMNRWSSTAPVVNHIAQLTKTPFTPGEPEWLPMGAGFDGNVWSIVFHNGSIYAAGDFTASGTTQTLRVARWTGSTWVAVGAGFNDRVRKLLSYNGSLYAGGYFTASGATSTGGLARFDGTNWQPVGGFFAGQVHALAIDPQNRMAIGGLFTGINSSPNLAWFNGSIYGTYGTGGADGLVQSLATAGPDLIVGGGFANLGGLPIRRIGRWNGAAWSGLAGGTDSSVRALAFYRGEVQAGGGFDTVGPSSTVSPLWARYSDTGVPWVGQQPRNQSVCKGGTANMQAGVATGYPVDTHTWRKNGVPLAAGPTPWGSSISIYQDSLYVFRSQPQDQGMYDYVATGPCGTATSFTAQLTVCVADVNCDDLVSVQDIFDYLSLYFQNDPDADVNGTGTVTVQDIFDFLTAYFAGCS